MKRIILSLIAITALITAEENTILQGVSFFSPRSQTTDAARHIVGWHPYTHIYESPSWYLSLAATPEFTKSIRPNRIAEALFGVENLHISGSLIETRASEDILADYFGLSPTFQSTVELDPYIQNLLVEFSMYFGFDAWVPGLYLEAFAPAVWTKWHMQMYEEVLNTGESTPYPALYMAQGFVTAPVPQFSDAFTGKTTFGQMTQPLAFGKICGAQTQGGLSDLLMILGYDAIQRELGYFSVNARITAPTGSRPNSNYFFEPIIGNGKHWELGVGFDGKGVIWQKASNQECSFFATVNLSHIFKARQRRSFDFCANGFGSRFVLLKEFNKDKIYAEKLLPAINVTTLCCDVWMDLEFEMLAMFGYTHNGFVFDIGYNGWIRSKEKISLRECIEDNKYALKGIQNVATISDDPSNRTQSTATLMGNSFDNQPLVADINSPVFIKTADLDLRSAASPMILTHKLFVHLGNSWKKSDKDHIVPFFGVGGSIEFEGINTQNTFKPNRNTLSQWGVWFKGGVAFI
jgi:hypothetical protein